MKKIFLFIILLVSLGAQAQDKSVTFKLQPTGSFLSEDGQEYIVVDFEGKSADELYSMVKSNVMSLYNNPDAVMSESDGNMISIYAYNENMWVVSSLGAKGIYGGHYKLVFRFKDGRVRIDAPSIDEKLAITGGAFTGTIGIHENVYLSSCAKKACNGKSKKDKEKKEQLEYVVNNPINYLLGFSKKQQSNDDW